MANSVEKFLSMLGEIAPAISPNGVDPQKEAAKFSGVGQVNQYNKYVMPSLQMQVGSRKTGETLLSSIGGIIYPNKKE
jgi:hypothetical protein